MRWRLAGFGGRGRCRHLVGNPVRLLLVCVSLRTDSQFGLQLHW